MKKINKEKFKQILVSNVIDKYDFVILVLSVFGWAIGKDFNLVTLNNVSNVFFFVEFTYCLCWTLSAFIYAIIDLIERKKVDNGKIESN